MRQAIFLILLFFSAWSFSDESIQINDIKFDFFDESDMKKGQCGCWYYYPFEKGLKGEILALGEAATDSIYLKLNGDKIKVGNWSAKYEPNFHVISYADEVCKLNIESEVINESQYSSSFKSTINISFQGREAQVVTHGSCGC